MAAPAPWGFRSRLPWPAARGERLWTQLTAAGGLPAYNVELCEPTAGHVALVLVRKPGRASNGSAPSTPVAAGASVPRVVIVVDAVPPSVRRSAAKPQSSPTLSPASTASTRSSSNGVSSSGANGTEGPLLQDVDELDLVDELFATAKTGKDGCVLAKAPLLCARLDARVVAIRFTRGSYSRQAVSTSGNEHTVPLLRCVVAREDGVAFVWEWGPDLHQWTFLNQFSFLENPNLAWTKPVALFAATDMAWHGEVTEFAWWSREAKHEPKLWLRQVQFEQEPSTFRTEITLGHAFALQSTGGGVVTLASSKLGLWIVTKASGVHLRSAASLRMASLGWDAVVADAAVLDPETQLLTCVHNVTGELLVLERSSGRVHLVTPKQRRPHDGSSSGDGLAAKLLATLAFWTLELGREAQTVAAHRHVVLVTTHETLHAFNYLTGERVACVALPGAESIASPLPDFQDDDGAITTTMMTPTRARFWTISGAASAVGLWRPTGFWFLQTPPAKALASSNNHKNNNPKAAFEALAAYGEGLRFDAAQQALEILEKVCKSLDSYDERVWTTAFASVSSPALLLALFADQNVPETLVDELARIVASLQQLVRDVATGGRFASLSLSLLPDKTSSAHQLNPTQRLTPANVEALHHLSNWVLLAKRKITRLQTSAHASLTSSQRRARPRAVSVLTTVSSEPADAQLSSSPLSPLEHDDDGDHDHDAANFRLSRKLRPMSSLRFASGSCAVQHGKQWLLQLESFLLDGVAFKDGAVHSLAGTADGTALAVPSHLLFHEERRLADYRSSVASFSRHMYVESMSRLYLLHEPQSLLPFVACVSEFCPRTFSLSGTTRVSRSHAERALSLSPPLGYFTERVSREQQIRRSALSSSSSSHRTRQLRQAELSAALATDSLLAYTALLCRCGFYLEACRGLLQCDLFEHCEEAVLGKLLAKNADHHEHDRGRAPITTAGAGGSDLHAVQGAVYFELFAFCVKHRGVAQLTALLERKPPHVSVLHVLRALRTHLSTGESVAAKNTEHEPPVSNSSSKSDGSEESANIRNAQHVSVGELRPVLLSLMKQQRAAAAQVA